MEETVREAKIDELTLDEGNTNLGTEIGVAMLDKSSALAGVKLSEI